MSESKSNNSDEKASIYDEEASIYNKLCEVLRYLGDGEISRDQAVSALGAISWQLLAGVMDIHARLVKIEADLRKMKLEKENQEYHQGEIT